MPRDHRSMRICTHGFGYCSSRYSCSDACSRHIALYDGTAETSSRRCACGDGQRHAWIARITARDPSDLEGSRGRRFARTLFEGNAVQASEKMCAARTDYGRLVENIVLSNGSTVAVQNPLAMLYTCAEKSEKFADLLARTVAQTESPLNIILYLDGITPADALTKADSRKITAIYWSFLEFGPKMLSSEDVWFCVACTRLTITNELDGQISNLLYEIMTRFFSISMDQISLLQACFCRTCH